ncbi:hypothetical protein Tco_0135033 [Tanacetum coccineum]
MNKSNDAALFVGVGVAPGIAHVADAMGLPRWLERRYESLVAAYQGLQTRILELYKEKYKIQHNCNKLRERDELKKQVFELDKEVIRVRMVTVIWFVCSNEELSMYTFPPLLDIVQHSFCFYGKVEVLSLDICQDFSDESVGSSPSWIILFGTILAKIPAETPTIPSVVPTLPHTLPLLCTDSSDSDTSEKPPSHDPYKDTVSRWRSRVAALQTTLPTSHSLRKRVRALPSVHLASRYLLNHSSSNHFSSDGSSFDSSSDSSSDYSSDSSSCHSLLDSSFVTTATISARPSCKRCRSPAVSVPLATPVPGAFVTPPKSQHRSGIPLVVLLHSSNTQVTENNLKIDV